MSQSVQQSQEEEPLSDKGRSYLLPEADNAAAAEVQVGTFLNDTDLNVGEAGAVDPVFAESLKQETVVHRKMITLGVAWSALLITSVIAATSGFHTLDARYSRFEIDFIYFMFVSGAFAASTLTLRMRSIRRALLKPLMRCKDVQNLPAIILALQIEHQAIRDYAKKALTKLLPKLRADQDGLLGPMERAILAKRMRQSPGQGRYIGFGSLFSSDNEKAEIEFRLAVLQAYQQVGGELELPIVEALVANDGGVLTRQPDIIVEAAQSCLPFLQAKAQKQQSERELVRPSLQDDVGGASLLRPTAPAPEAHKGELLHTVVGPWQDDDP